MREHANEAVSEARMVSASGALEMPKEMEAQTNHASPVMGSRLPPAKHLMQQEALGVQHAAETVRRSPHLSEHHTFHDQKSSIQHVPNREYDRILPKINNNQLNGHADVNGAKQSPVSHTKDVYVHRRQFDELADTISLLAASVAAIRSQVDGFDQRIEQIQHLAAQAGNIGPVRTLSDSLATVIEKVGQLDGLKMQVEFLKSEMKDISATTGNGAVATHNLLAARQPPVAPHATPVGFAPRSVPGHQPFGASAIHTPVRIPSNAANSSFPPAHRPQDHMISGALAGFTSINQAAKRLLPGSGDERAVDSTSAVSPKRPKLAPLEPAAYQQAISQPHHRPLSAESRQDSALSPRQYSYVPNLTPSASMDSPMRDVRGLAPKTAPATSLPNSPKVARSTLRGRPRKSGPFEHDENIDGEQSRIQGSDYAFQINRSQDGSFSSYPPAVQPALSRQVSSGVIPPPEAILYPIPPPLDIKHHQAHVPVLGIPGTPHHMMPSMTIVPGGPDGMGEPYAHTRKTRTKPFRNADGVLIRKDGRPDMRSQSSAANLKKVHARKDNDRHDGTAMGSQRSPPVGKPGSAEDSHASSPVLTATQSPELSNEKPGKDGLGAEQEQHDAVTPKMFPMGTESSDGAYGFGNTEKTTPNTREIGLPPRGQVSRATTDSALDKPGTNAHNSTDGAEAMEGVDTGLPKHGTEQRVHDISPPRPVAAA